MARRPLVVVGAGEVQRSNHDQGLGRRQRIGIFRDRPGRQIRTAKNNTRELGVLARKWKGLDAAMHFDGLRVLLGAGDVDLAKQLGRTQHVGAKSKPDLHAWCMLSLWQAGKSGDGNREGAAARKLEQAGQEASLVVKLVGHCRFLVIATGTLDHVVVNHLRPGANNDRLLHGRARSLQVVLDLQWRDSEVLAVVLESVRGLGFRGEVESEIIIDPQQVAHGVVVLVAGQPPDDRPPPGAAFSLRGQCELARQP